MVSNILTAPASPTKENGWKSLIGGEPCSVFTYQSMAKYSDGTKEKYTKTNKQKQLQTKNKKQTQKIPHNWCWAFPADGTGVT